MALIIVALYIRVSTEEQAQHGYSIDNQKDRLEAYCKSQGWNNFRFYIDDGYTGTNMDRPALQKLIKDVNEGKIQTVIVYRLDRLGRKQKDVLHLLEDVFDKNNVAFKSATEPFDTSTPLGKAMLGILAVFAQLERDTIVERVTSAMQMRTKKGLWNGGPVTLGYRLNDETKQLEVIPEHAELVLTIFKKFTQGQSMGEIASWLHPLLPDHRVNYIFVRRILKRPLYIGKVYNKDLIVDGSHEPIIPEELWNQAQLEFEKRNSGEAKPIRKYLLSGLLKCEICGKSFLPKRKRSRGKLFEYYECVTHRMMFKDVPRCKTKLVRQDFLENFVVKSLMDLGELELDVVQKQIAATKEGPETKALITELKNKLPAIERKINRWKRAYEDEEINIGEWRELTSELKEERNAIELRIEELEGQQQTGMKASELLSLAKEAAENWEDMTFEERQVILRTVISKIVISPSGEPHIEWNI